MSAADIAVRAFSEGLGLASFVLLLYLAGLGMFFGARRVLQWRARRRHATYSPDTPAT